MNILTAEMTPEMEALKTRLKATWMSGDYGHFATYLEAGALEFLSCIRIEQAGARARAENLDARFEEGDAIRH